MTRMSSRSGRQPCAGACSDRWLPKDGQRGGEIEGHVVVSLLGCRRASNGCWPANQLIAQGDVLIVLEHRELDPARSCRSRSPFPACGAARRPLARRRIRPVTLCKLTRSCGAVQGSSARSGGTRPVEPARRCAGRNAATVPPRFAEPGQNQCTGAGVGPGDPPCCRAGSAGRSVAAAGHAGRAD